MERMILEMIYLFFFLTNEYVTKKKEKEKLSLREKEFKEKKKKENKKRKIKTLQRARVCMRACKRLY